MSDVDDLPDLIDSSDEDSPGVQKKSEDHAVLWLGKPTKFRQKQEQWMRVFTLGPLLYGMDNIIAVAWIKALTNAELTKETKEEEVTYLDWPEWECVDLLDVVVKQLHERMRKKDALVEVLDCVTKLDGCRSGVIIDVDQAIREADKVSTVTDIWQSVLDDQASRGKEKAAKFAVLYCMKLYQEHVLSLSNRKEDYVDKTIKSLTHDTQLADVLKNSGNNHFKEGKYQESIGCYTSAAKKDPFNHIYYGNRAQAYHKLKQYMGALADGRRAINIKPDYPKGHYRYALAFYELGQLESAIRVVDDGLKQFQGGDISNVTLLELQRLGLDYKAEKTARLKDGGSLLTPLPKKLDEKFTSQPKEKFVFKSVEEEHEAYKNVLKEEKLKRAADFGDTKVNDDLGLPKKVLKKLGIDPKLTWKQAYEENVLNDSSDGEEFASFMCGQSPPHLCPHGHSPPEPAKVKKKVQTKTKTKTKSESQDHKQKEVKPDTKDSKAKRTSSADKGNKASEGNKASSVTPTSTTSPGVDKGGKSSEVNKGAKSSEVSKGAKSSEVSKGAKSSEVSKVKQSKSESKETKSSMPAPVMSNTPTIESKSESQNGISGSGTKAVSSEVKMKGIGERKKEDLGQELVAHMNEGSESIGKNIGKVAMSSYQKALDIISHHGDKMKMMNVDEQDIVTLKYAHGIAAVMSGIHKNILEGIDKFNNIIDHHREVRFPVAYYGLGRAYITLNRYPDAMDPLTVGISIASKVSYATVTWPGTTNIIQETSPSILVEKMKGMLQLCKFPPPPDAVCRYHTDVTDSRTVIYLSDPDFKGYVKIICQEDCIIFFHNSCWKMYKSNLSKHTDKDKDVLETPCPTPDCGGLIIKLEIIRSDSTSKEHISPLKDVIKSKKPVTKQKPCSEDKLVKKQQKKEMKKQKKRQRQEEKDDLIEKLSDSERAPEEFKMDAESSEAVGVGSPGDVREAQPLPDMKSSTVLKKDEDLNMVKTSAKSKKSKKKKDKSKQIINLEVNFTDRKEEALRYSMYSDDEEKTSSQSSNLTPFSVPSKLKSQITSFEETYQGNAKELFKPDEITENLFSYFAVILEANGPLAFDDVKIQQELEVFPSEALDRIKQVGGLSDFLRQSLKFAIIDDVVALMSDAKRAREIALLRRNERANAGKQAAPAQNAWKTVGKTVNVVDSLKESDVFEESANFPTVTQAMPNSSVNQTIPNSSSQLYNIPSSRSNPALYSSNSANSLNSTDHVAPPSSSSFPSFHQNSGDTNTFTTNVKTKTAGIDSLDSIDDFPSAVSAPLERKKLLDNLDDFNIISDPGTHVKETTAASKPALKPDSAVKAEVTMSRSSSKSDVSDRSASDYSAEWMPKPLRPLNVGSTGLGLGGVGKTNQMWDKLDDDFNSSWSKVSNDMESVDNSSVDSVNQELRKATAEYVRNSDEKLVTELAESVVEKLYKGKIVPENERVSMFERVSSDIRKDFEKNMKLEKSGGASLWADTPAGADYSKNMGKFANDFMKKHYEKTEGNAFSPTSSVTLTYPPKPISPLDSFTAARNNSGVNSPTLSWSMEDDDSTRTSVSAPSSVSSSVLSSMPSLNTGYNLFSGPQWGIDSFNSASSGVIAPIGTKPPPSTFIRPPPIASSYYQPPIGPLPTAAVPPLAQFHPSIPPPRLPIPYPPPSTPPVEKKEKETQCGVSVTTTGTMTEVYEPYKKEYLTVKDEKEMLLQQLRENKSLSEKLIQEYKAKEQRIQILDADISNKMSKYELEKANWMSERESFSEEIRRLKQQLATKDSNEKELKSRMEGQEKRVNELAILAKDQRDKDFTEIKKCMQIMEDLQKKFDSECARAKAAEIEILKGRHKTATSLLERHQKEAGHRQQHLKGFMTKHQEEKQPVPSALQQTYDYWTLVLDKSEESMGIVKSEYDAQITEIKDGKLLTNLPPVTIPSPPPVPEAVKAFSMMPRGPHTFPNRPMLPAPTSSNTPGFTSAPTTMGPTSMMPKPLTQPSATPLPPRPLSGVRHPLSGPGKSPLRPLGIPGMGMQPVMSSFEKLMMKMQEKFPGKSRAELNQMVQELRTVRGGSLSGMTIEDIIANVAEARRTEPASNSQTQTSRAVAPPPGLNSSWAFHVAGGGAMGGAKGQQQPLTQEFYQEEEDPCVICHEEMTMKMAVTLECSHRFHEECIRKWFQEQSTCPNCRVHTLLSDDFPTLG